MANKKNQPERVWRWLVNIWMVLVVALMMADFLLKGRFTYVVSPVAMIYVSLLSVYVTTKEFERWFLLYKSHHPGEIGVVVWTLLLITMLFISIVLGEDYKITQDVISTYLTVIIVFVITKASKHLFEERRPKKRNISRKAK